MFLKSLTILSESKEIRKITFKKGINLIVDETPTSDNKITGNNVGKTTVLKLIDFCLGANPRIIYIDPESQKDVYSLVKNYLVNNKITIQLILKDNLDDDKSDEIIIERNFLSYKKRVKKINGENLTDDEFEIKLSNLIFPEHHSEKPTFRQIISHNIRYKDESINQTLKTLDKYTSDAEYETLYLFLFGCEFSKGNAKQEILERIRQENTFKNRLEKVQTKTAYETALSLINSEIEKLDEKKSSFNVNKNFEEDLEKLNIVKYEINKISSDITKIRIRKDLIIEAQEELSAKQSNIDLEQLKLIYSQATNKIESIHKTFDDLVKYHNQMIAEKVRFITKELPDLEKQINSRQQDLKKKLNEEVKLSSAISKSDSFEELEELIIEINEKYRKKGEYESVINQLDSANKNIQKNNKDLQQIEDELFSDNFENTVKKQLEKFNKHFSAISDKLYGEKYAIKYDIITNRNNQKLYKFTAFNLNFSSGKKQGEISCFDIAYTMFADEENIPCLHFLLNDKKELMHDNQLVKIAEFVNDNNIQFVASILKDKLPNELNHEENFAVKLSQGNKLFRIENN
jgi:uncharacterized protein YydD (DUF2326 family)